MSNRIFLYVITLLMTAIYTYGQTDKELQKIGTAKNQSYREISGYITSSGSPLINVNIIIKKTNRGTKTNSKGFYTIKAKEGEVLQFTHIGMLSLEIIVEDVTKVLNIKMRVKKDVLDEVTVIAEKKQIADFKPKAITTSQGITIDRRKAGYSISYVDGKDLNLAMSLGQALVGRVPGLGLQTDAFGNGFVTIRGKSAIWDVDGMFFENEPPLDLQDVKDVTIIRSIAGTNAYGIRGRGNGGVIIVRTKMATFHETNTTLKFNPHADTEYYQEDALLFKELKSLKPKYLKILDTISSSQEAYTIYQKMMLRYSDLTNFYLDVADYFQKKHQNSLQSFKVLSDMETAFANNPEALKALAYTYQEQGLYSKAMILYKKIIDLRPTYAQSFRDLANAYVDLKQYQNAWKIYMNYLFRGNKLDNSGIGQMIYHEMEAIYIHKKDVANIKETFELKGKPSELSKDVRMIFEWNTSEAEFELEFVKPQKKHSYTFEHSFFGDKNLIADEKQKGYSSIEFMIEDLTGDWLVSLRYFGNKKNTPTYLKITVYYNWERPNQMQEIKLFKLVDTDLKLQLIKINAEFLASKNKQKTPKNE